jgi:sugar lactone lactonase YvrE
VADADRGLLALDPYDGGIESLVTSVNGRRMRFCNNAAVAANGDIWFSTPAPSTGSRTGRRTSPRTPAPGGCWCVASTGLVEVVLEGLAFANGVALAADESYVAVAETGARTVVRHWLTGPRAGERDLLAEDLPGYPDNISRGSDGLVWVTIASPTDRIVERLHRSPMVVRRRASRIPDALQPQPEAHRAGAGLRRRRPARARPAR